MKTGIAALIGLIVLLGSVGFGQSPLPAAVSVSTGPDIYANFVGTWIGTSRVLRDNSETTTPVKIEVTEDAYKKHLRFFFTFSESGRIGFDHVTRVATLNPTKNEMTWLETDRPNAPDAFRRTEGLDEFARKGYGVFEASFDYGFGNHHLVGRCHYILDPNMFTYIWYQSVDGGPIVKYSVTQVTRKIDSMAVLRPPKF